jgi:hypothetical protein
MQQKTIADDYKEDVIVCRGGIAASRYWMAKWIEQSFLRSRYPALGLIYLEFEPLRDEAGNALHHAVILIV